MVLTIEAQFFLTASVLGITHGIEPDHVAGITAITHQRGNLKLSTLVGACFAAGHAALVLIWITFTYLLVGATSFPPVFEQFGTLVVGVILLILGFYLGITSMNKIIKKRKHKHSNGLHSPYHSHLPVPIQLEIGNINNHRDNRSVVDLLKIGMVGALFTLSPPVSMIAFISVTMSEKGETFAVGVAAAYTVSIIVTMAVIGSIAGAMFRFSKAKGEYIHAITQAAASVLVLVF